MTRPLFILGAAVLATSIGIAHAQSNISPSGDVDPLPRAPAETVGMSGERLDRLGALLTADVESGQLPGAVVAVARRGKLVFYRAFGYLDPVARTRMPRNAIFSIGSMTTPLVTVGALSLVEQGRMIVNDPVGKYLPSLARMPVAVLGKDGKPTDKTTAAIRQPTIQDLMRHTAGYSYGSRGDSALYRAYPTTSGAAAATMTSDDFIKRLSESTLVYQPGSRWEYSLSFDVLGVAMEKVSGQKLSAFLQERIFKPLGMGDTGFSVTGDKVARVARPFPNDPVTGRPQVMEDVSAPGFFDCGGGCGSSTAADYLRFAQMLLDKGRIGDQHILSRKTVEYMTADQLGPEVELGPLRAYPSINGYGFGLGVAVRRTLGGPALMGSPGEFHWAGSNGTNFWVDPKEELVVVFMAHTPGPQRLHYRQIINTMVMQSLDS